MGYIYKITCIVNGKVYIGRSKNDPEFGRIQDHLSGRGNEYLANAVDKYGKDAFAYEILEADVFDECLPDLEKFYIAKYDCIRPNGFNFTEGGEGTLGYTHTPETCEKISRKAKGRKRGPHSEETKRKIAIGNTNKVFTQERKDNISHANKGKKRSAEHRLSMSERNSGEGNPMYGRNRREDKEYIQKISGDDSPMAHPCRKPVRKLFDLLPSDTSLKEKRECLYVKFPDVKRSTIQHWTLIWIREPILSTDENNPHYDMSNTRILPEKSSAHDLFFSLPADMPMKEKRNILAESFPNIKRETITSWIRAWIDYKPYKEGSRGSAEYHQAHDMFLSLDSNMTTPEKRKMLQDKFSTVPRGTISRWVKQWTNTTGRQPTHPDYERAYKFFLSLPSDINLKEKKRLLRENFPDISPSSWRKWIKKWTGETMPTGAPCHPKRPEIYEYFLSLPQDMPISEKRKSIVENFGDVANRSLVNRWTHRWHTEVTGAPPPDERWYREPPNNHKKGKPSHNRRPEYGEAKDFFFHLPSGMSPSERNRKLRKKYPNIPKGTISQWIHHWQSDLEKETSDDPVDTN